MATAAQNFKKDDERPIKLFFQDEARFGRINKVRKCWVPPNSRAIIGQQLVRQYTYAYACVCPETGENFSLILPYANTDGMNIFIEEFAKEFHCYRNLIVMDKSGWHVSKSLVSFDNIAFIYLPPYSPELNPAEHLWEYIREQKGFNNNVFKSLSEVEDKLSQSLLEMSIEKDKIKSLTDFNWIHYMFC
jgi:transposase